MRSDTKRSGRSDDERNIPCSYTFSRTAVAVAHDLAEEPVQSSAGAIASGETIPLSAFSHAASTMQAIARYLVDIRGFSFSDAARLLHRSPKSIWASYHQTALLPPLAEDTLSIPLLIFVGTRAPLEALVTHLKARGLRNVDIARLLGLDPRTVWTAAKRAEVRA